MDYVFSLIDERLNVMIVEDAYANRNGMHTILERVCGMKPFARGQFMKELDEKGAAEIIAGPKEEFYHSIFATRTGRPASSDDLLTNLRRKLELNVPPRTVVNGPLYPQR